jgi:hypothetical protein
LFFYTGPVVKAQSDITTTKANAIATLPKETLISRCEANQGFKFASATADLMMKMPLETKKNMPLYHFIKYG